MIFGGISAMILRNALLLPGEGAEVEAYAYGEVDAGGGGRVPIVGLGSVVEEVFYGGCQVDASPYSLLHRKTPKGVG